MATVTKLLVRAALFVAIAALGLGAATLVLPGFHVSFSGLSMAVVSFAVLQSLITPLVTALTKRYAEALLGGIGLISTFLALLVASLLPDGLRIEGLATWVLGTLIVWLVTALASWLLPRFVERSAKRRDAA